VTDALPSDEHPARGFHLRTIGPEPSGATPIEEQDLDGLIPDFVTTRADLNQVEFENVLAAFPWAQRQARLLGVDGVLDYGFMVALHRRMFGDVWRWAGTQRWRITNIGVEPHLIVAQSRLLFDDARFWHTRQVFAPDELAARVHCRLVSVHPFQNGNGRCTRMMADLYLTAIGAKPFSWVGGGLDVEGSSRAAYIAALVRAASTGEYADLVRFARGKPTN
jgi:Fic-DOC domain mobile mystery protein B